MGVHPDRVDAEALRHLDLPFQVVADHPGVTGLDAERSHGVVIGSLVGLAKTVLALDLDVIESLRQREALDLAPLRCARAISDERKLHPGSLEGLQGLMHAG